MIHAAVPPCLLLKSTRRILEKKILFLFALMLLLSANSLSQCITPAATINAQPGAAACNGQPFNLILSNSTAGTAPFDLTITGPAGTATYNDIPVGGVITNFIPPTEKLWPALPTPIPSTNEDASVTLGVKFKTAGGGFVKGVRFFSPDDIAEAPGSYTGQLWTASGTLLASGTFTGVTNSDWQELVFTSPILISANTTYIASYHTKGIKYVGTAAGFTSTVTNGSLTAPDNLSSGGNGVYAYGAAAGFPVNSVGANYWVDVMFSPNSYTFNLTGIKDANECANTGALQTLTITSGDCSELPVNIVINQPAITRSVGQSFTVFVAADFTGTTLSAGIDEIELHLAFDKTKLSVTSIAEEPIINAFTSKPIPLEATPYTNVNATGQINYAASTTNAIPISDFTILAITFLVTGGDGTTTSLTLRKDLPSDETRAMRNGSSVLADVVNGHININPAGCTTPVATISTQAGNACNGKPFNLILSNSTAGTAPFDLTITGSAGTTTYNNIPVGGVITTIIPPTEKLWPVLPTPVPSTHEDASVTLGVKFKTAVGGFVKGVRFFSPDDIAEAPGSYTGQLWTGSGTLLASGTFTGVTNSDWQELVFTTPILISANTTYIASYHTMGNRYVGTAAGFASSVSNGSLTAPDNLSSGGNGVYAYGEAAGFPANSVGANYWVDVIYSPNSYTFNLTGIKDANECTNSGALQMLTVSPGNCGTNNSLPVSLTNLSATPSGNTIVLHWITSSEINNLGFEVQRSLNGSNWSALGFVNGAGNSSFTQRYMYADENLASGRRYYYRLKQIDIDKRFEYSPVVSAVLGSTESFSLDQNYPNPFRNATIVRFTLPQQSNVKLSLFDMHGRLVKILVNETKDKGTHAVNFNGATLTSGLYYYRIQAGDFSAMKKMIIQ